MGTIPDCKQKKLSENQFLELTNLNLDLENLNLDLENLQDINPSIFSELPLSTSSEVRDLVDKILTLLGNYSSIITPDNPAFIYEFSRLNNEIDDLKEYRYFFSHLFRA